MASKLTVDMLKHELQKLGLSTSGLKSSLVARLEEAQKAYSSPVANTVVLATTPVASTTRQTIATGSAKKRADRQPLEDKFDAKRAPARREQLFTPPSTSAAETMAEETYPEQTFLNTHIGYLERGQCKDLTEAQTSLFEFIAAECRLPADLSVNPQYGVSRSGLCYEERAIGAFAHGLLDAASLSGAAQGVRLAVRSALTNNDYDQAAVIVAVRRAVAASQ
jgi:hypothetical protein